MGSYLRYTTKGGLVHSTINLFTVVVKSLQKLITIFMPSICNLLTATVFINYKSLICYYLSCCTNECLYCHYRCTMGYKWVQIPALVMKREQYECEYTDWAYHWHNRILWLVDAVQMFDFLLILICQCFPFNIACRLFILQYALL